MSGKQMYAEPISHLALDESDLTRLRRELEVAELQVRRATTWPAKTRAEQDVISLQRQIQGAEVQQRLDQAHQRLTRPRTDVHAALLQKAVAEGRCLAPVPYFARQAAEDSLTELKAAAHRLQAVIDNPASTADAKLSARAELDRITQLIRSLEQMHPVAGTPAGNSRTEAVSFADAGKLLALAHTLGMVKSV